VSFFDREAEIAVLDALGRRRAAQLVAVFGRRRIGKTALLVHWLDTRRARGTYWVAYRSTSARLLARFSQALQPLLGVADAGFSFSSWEAALEQLARACRHRPAWVVIDELPYLMESVPSFATTLQAVWDHALRHGHARLILAGSHYHMMQQTFGSQRGALFGRATATLHLEEVDTRGMSLFLPQYSPEQLVETYSVVGGVPKYLEMWSDRRPVLRNVRDVVLGPETVFRNEPAFLVQDEIADPRTYLAILEAIGSGARRPVQIAKSSGVQLAHIGRYLHTLAALRFTRRVVSAEARGAAAARNARHEIRDPYLRFHFAFVQPHLRLLEQGRLDRLMEVIRAGFDAHVGRTGYEEICRRHVARLADRNELPFEALQVGRLWDRGIEIDVAALDARGRVALVGECRWRRRRMGVEDLESLVARASRAKKLGALRRHYALFSRAGFTTALERRAARDGVLLVRGVPI
jgi:hypothetical protein